MIIKQAPKSNIECSTLLGSKYKQAVRLWRRGRISRYDYKIYGGVEWWIINNSWNLTLHFPTRLICWPKDLIWFSNDFQILTKENQEKRIIFVAPWPGNFLKHRKINWKASHLLTAERLENDERRTAFILTGTSI